MQSDKPLTREELHVLEQIKRVVDKNTDAIVKMSRDGELRVYQSKIRRVD